MGNVLGKDIMPWILPLYTLPTGHHELDDSSLTQSDHCDGQIFWKLEAK